MTKFKDIDEAISSLDKAFEHAELTGEFNGDDFQSRVNACIAQFPSEKKYCLDHYQNFVNCGLGDDKNEYGFVCFAEAIVSVYKDVNDLPLLLSYFDDAKDPEWAFDNLVTTIEQYYLAGLPYIETLLRNLGDLNRKAIAWAGRLVARILSSSDAYAIFKQNVSQANPDDLVRLLQYMRCHEDDFDYVEPQVNELLETLGA